MGPERELVEAPGGGPVAVLRLEQVPREPSLLQVERRPHEVPAAEGGVREAVGRVAGPARVL